MSAVATMPNKPAAKPQQQTRGQQVTTVLERSRDNLEAPFREGEKLARAVRDMPPGTPSPFALPLPGAGSHVDKACRWIAGGPSLAMARDLHAKLTAAAGASVNPDATRLQLGLLLDSFPNARDQREAYFATLGHDVIDEGHGPYVVAEACRVIRRRATFIPSIGEVLSECADQKNTLARYLALAEACLTMGEACALAVQVAETDPSEWQGEWWFNACQDWRAQRQTWGKERVAWPDYLGPAPNEPGNRVPVAVRELMGWPATVEPQAEAA